MSREGYMWYTRVLLLFPLQDLLPRLLIQKIVYLHHCLDVLLWGLPSLPNQRVVELLWRGVLPPRGPVAWDRGLGAGGGQLRALTRRRGLRERWHLVERVNFGAFVAYRALCRRRCGRGCVFDGALRRGLRGGVVWYRALPGRAGLLGGCCRCRLTHCAMLVECCEGERDVEVEEVAKRSGSRWSA